MINIIIFHALTNSRGSVYGGIVIHEGVVIIWEMTCNNWPQVIVNDANIFSSIIIAFNTSQISAIIKTHASPDH